MVKLKTKILTAGLATVLLFTVAVTALADNPAAIKIILNGNELPCEVSPVIIDNRTMVPIRAISEGMGLKVDWDAASRQVNISDPNQSNPEQSAGTYAESVAIMGDAVLSSAALKQLLKNNNPSAPDLVDLYLSIGKEYGIRGDIAFCQAAKETGWWRFTGLVQPEQNNYCGLGATGSPATGTEDLGGADPARVSYQKDRHGAFFSTPAAGVEAHIQHLYAYTSKEPLPAGKVLLDPRFVKVTRGNSPRWVDLGGKWAVPGYDRSKYATFADAFSNGETYGHSILKDYYLKGLQIQSLSAYAADELTLLKQENERLKLENDRLKAQLQAAGL
jgi:hypothetical protein